MTHYVCGHCHESLTGRLHQMDPQATLQRITDAVTLAQTASADPEDPDLLVLDEARLAYAAACQDLCRWLAQGGAAPSVSRAGITQYIPGTGTRYAILSPEPSEMAGVTSLFPHWEIVRYNEHGTIAERYPLAD
jgi:hypothetical protein